MHTVTVMPQSCDCWHRGHLPGSCQGQTAGLCLSKQGNALRLARLSFQPRSGMISCTEVLVLNLTLPPKRRVWVLLGC